MAPPVKLVLTVLTLGVWVIVWALVAIFGGEKRRLLSVQPDGSVRDTKV